MQRQLMIGGVFTACLFVAAALQAAAIKGRVVDSAGRPVAGAEIRVWRKTRPGVIPIGQNEPVKLEKPLRTDDDGRFVSPDIGDAGQAVRIVALAEGMLAGRSGWVAADEVAIEVPDIALRRLRVVEGRVVDRQQRGVEEATVFHAGEAHQRVETKTGAEGRFRLEGVPEGLAAIFSQKVGYRFTGDLVDGEDASLVVTKEGEEPQRLAGGEPRMPEADRVALGRRLGEPYLAAVVERGGDRDKYWAILSFGHLEPIDAIERLSRCTFDDKSWRDGARGGVISDWIEGKPADGWDDIRGLIESNEDQMWVGVSYLRGAEAMPANDRQTRLDWINQGALHARQCDTPSMRTHLLALAASLLETLGEGNQAEQLRSEARGIAPRSPGQDPFALYALSELAAASALTDLPAALEYLGSIDDANFHARASVQVALRLAPSQPLEAEKVWGQAAQPKNKAIQAGSLHWRDNESPLFCFRLAGADRACAERVAADINDPTWRVRARGAIAWALAESDPPAARDFLRRAIDDAREGAAAASLLSVAEHVDPAMMADIFWRAIALREPTPTTDQLEDDVEIARAKLAQMLARYDSSVARQLLAPAAARVNQWTGPAEEFRQKAMRVIGAAATVDPLWAAELLEAMPDPPDLAFRRPKNESRNMLLRVLGMSEAQLWKSAGYWQPE